MQNITRKTTSLSTIFLTRILWLISILLLSSTAKPAALNLSDLPLFVTSNVPPNVVISMDDSGSMAWGWMPDGRNSYWRETFYRSSHFNKVFYDPEVTYTPPSDYTGKQISDASFNAAVRGYYYDASKQVVIDLETNFVAVFHHYYNDATPDLLGEDEAGFGCGVAEGEPCDEQPAYYYQFIEENSGCTGTDSQKLIDSDCYSKVVITDTSLYDLSSGLNNYDRTMIQEKTNFANWYQFYAIRGDAGKTALMRAFVPESMDSSIRVGRQTFNSDTQIESGPTNAEVNGVSELTDTERENLYEWVGGVKTSGGTPLRSSVVRAGDYYSNADAYRENPRNSSSNAISCRLNANILVTDGLYNGSVSNPSNFNRDDASTTLPDGTVYTPNADHQKIYPNSSVDSNGASLADLTFHYWSNDLISTYDDNLPPYFVEDIEGEPTDEQYWNPVNDPASWQHMISYMVAFGLSGSVPLDETTYQSLLDGTSYTNLSGTTQTGWPSITTGAGKVDDLYHAGINGRGGFFNASDPNELVNSFKAISERIADRQATAATVVANSGRISSDNLVYVASFDTSKWVGHLKAYDVSDGSQFEKGGQQLSCNAKPFGELCGVVWDAAEKNTVDTLDYLTRKVYVYKPLGSYPGAPVGAGKPLVWDKLTSGQKSTLNGSDGLGQDRLNYVLGDASNEAKNGGVFRNRTGLTPTSADTRIGPLVHSSPVYVGAGADANGLLQFSFPDDLETAKYSDFLSLRKVENRKPMIYVGGNDGVLHAINAERNGGNEVFAFVPNAVLKNFENYTDPNFQSGAFVDGPLTVQDAFTGGSWRTLLVGGLRSGGRAYYALDITKPTAGAGKIVEWEFSDENDSDMGYTFGRAQIVRANNGKWVVVVGNGYNSDDGHAVLFVLDGETGAVVKKFTVDDTDSNGLSSPVSVSDDGDYNVDYTYAGDLKGNMWKFDMSDTDPANWTYVKLFAAGASKPITSVPALGNHPANQDGRVVYFGTGKYLEHSDNISTATQTFYGILDNDNCSVGSTCVSDSELVGQTIETSSSNLRTITDNDVNWSTSKGWKIDLSTGTGVAERVAGRPFIFGPLVIFVSIVPDNDPCNAGGSSFVYAVDRYNGGATSAQVLDTNDDGIVDDDDRKNDKAVAAYKLDHDTPSVSGTIITGSSSDSAQIQASLNVGGEGQLIENSGKAGRIRWRRLR